MSEFLSLMEKEGAPVSDIQKPADWEKRIMEYMDLRSNKKGYSVNKWTYLMREVLTTSDFPLLFGDVLQREILAAYKGVDPVWKAIVRPGTVPRIYPQVGGYRFAITGGDQYLAEVAEKGEYLASKRSEARYAVYVKKYGRQFDISWEALINDDKGALRDTPARFALAAARTEHRLVTGLYCDDVGTHAGGNLYQNGVNENTLALDITNLQASITAMRQFTDAGGEPIQNNPRYLVVGPALEWTARAILTSTVVQNMSGDVDNAVLGMPYPTANVVREAGLQLIVDPYIPILHADAPGSWFLFANPSDVAAIEFDRLEGHEGPEICMKASDKVALGGGAISPMEGDFATDNVLYRVRNVCGANKLDWRATYANIHA